MARKVTEKQTKFDIQDNHLMMVMDNMIQGLRGVESTLPHSNTIQVVGNGLGEALQNLVEQVPVMEMKVYKTNPHNLKNPTEKDLTVDKHVVLFTFHLLEHKRRLHIGRDVAL